MDKSGLSTAFGGREFGFSSFANSPELRHHYPPVSKPDSFWIKYSLALKIVSVLCLFGIGVFFYLTYRKQHATSTQSIAHANTPSNTPCLLPPSDSALLTDNLSPTGPSLHVPPSSPYNNTFQKKYQEVLSAATGATGSPGAVGATDTLQQTQITTNNSNARVNPYLPASATSLVPSTTDTTRGDSKGATARMSEKSDEVAAARDMGYSQAQVDQIKQSFQELSRTVSDNLLRIRRDIKHVSGRVRDIEEWVRAVDVEREPPSQKEGTAEVIVEEDKSRRKKN